MHGKQQDVKNRRQWRRFLINPRYQLKYILWIIGTGILLTVLNSSIFYHYIKENYAILVELAPMTDDARNQLYGELYKIAFALRITSVLFILLVGLWALILTHRTAGPLYHFRRVFNDIKNGNMNARVNLRPGDDFKDVAQSFNEMMDSLKQGK